MFLQGLSDLHTWGFIPKERDGLGVGVKMKVPEQVPVCGAQSGEVGCQESAPDFLFRWHQATLCPTALPLYHLRHGEYSLLL